MKMPYKACLSGSTTLAASLCGVEWSTFLLRVADRQVIPYFLDELWFAFNKYEIVCLIG